MTFVLGTIQLRKKMFTEGTVWYNNLLFILVEIRKIKSTLEVGQSVLILWILFFPENRGKSFTYFQTIYLCCRQGPSTKDVGNLEGLEADLYEEKNCRHMREGGKKEGKKLEKCANIFYGWSIMENIWRLLLHILMAPLGSNGLT